MPSKKKSTNPDQSHPSSSWTIYLVSVITFTLVIYNWANLPTFDSNLQQLLTRVDFTTYLNSYKKASTQEAKNQILELAQNIWGNDVSHYQKQEEDKIYSKIKPLENFLLNQGPNAPILRELAYLYRMLGKEKNAQLYENEALVIDPLQQYFKDKK